jgi:hypothetical protein
MVCEGAAPDVAVDGSRCRPRAAPSLASRYRLKPARATAGRPGRMSLAASWWCR